MFVYADVWGALAESEARCIHDIALIAPDGVFLELGCQSGKSTVTLAKADEFRKVYTIDNGIAQINHSFKDALDAFERYSINNVITISDTTEDRARTWVEPVALLYIDVSLLYNEVKRDFDLYFPFVVEDGYILFHDSTHSIGGVRQFIEKEVATRQDVEFVKRVETDMGLDVWKKKSVVKEIKKEIKLKKF